MDTDKTSKQAVGSYNWGVFPGRSPAGQGRGKDQVVVFAFAPCAVGVVPCQGDFDADIEQLGYQGFGFR